MGSTEAVSVESLLQLAVVDPLEPLAMVGDGVEAAAVPSSQKSIGVGSVRSPEYAI